MKSFYKLTVAVALLTLLLILSADIALIKEKNKEHGRPYLVEISRLAGEIEKSSNEIPNLSEYTYVTDVRKYGGGDLKNEVGESTLREINGVLYRFDYKISKPDSYSSIIIVNVSVALMLAVVFTILFYIRRRILLPFERMKDLPYELSKGNLTTPLKESKSRYFGRFMWGVDMLRESIEEQKRRELNLQKEKKTLVLSISHDIKTPLSAIKLYAGALSKGLYQDKEKQFEIAGKINEKADEIENFVSQIISASREDFLNLEVNIGDFYLLDMINKISKFYKEKLSIIKTEFTVGEYSDCLIKGDIDRSIEVLQNIIENAIKYGDGGYIRISFSEEENCILVSVRNSGCTLSETELPHIFDSFYRGSNASSAVGSGLGLYICRQLMYKMNGDIFAEIIDEDMQVTAVFVKS